MRDDDDDDDDGGDATLFGKTICLHFSVFAVQP